MCLYKYIYFLFWTRIRLILGDVLRLHGCVEPCSSWGMTLRPCGPSDLMFQPRRARLDLHTSKKRFFEAQGKGLRTPTFTQGLLLFHTRMPLHIQAIAQRQVYEQKAFAHRALDRRCFYTKLSLHIIACSYTQISFRATTHLNNSHSTRRHVEAQEGPGSSYTYKPVRVECFF